MLEFLINLDRALFYFINVSLSNPVTDFVMPIITADDYLRVMYGIAVVLLLWKGNSKVRWLVLFSGIAMLITDQAAAGLFKPLIARPRPCHVLENIHLLVGCGGGKSMPSAHAANSFAQAVLFGMYFLRFRIALLLVAALIAISRVFVGVHYPGDVIAGALIGSVVGLLLAVGHGKFIQWRAGDHESKED
jgi:undecaprenyl-diphosphatase